MAAQYGGTVKRMQHAFAARNGLLGALLARGGYGGFPRALERPHGGFLAMFSSGTSMTPQFLPEEVVKELGTFWQTPAIRVKLHACVGACHGLIECLAGLQAKYPEWLGEEADLEKIEKIVVEFSEGVFLKAGVRSLSIVSIFLCGPNAERKADESHSGHQKAVHSRPSPPRCALPTSQPRSWSTSKCSLRSSLARTSTATPSGI